jgi:hypothetical protein
MAALHFPSILLKVLREARHLKVAPSVDLRKAAQEFIPPTAAQAMFREPLQVNAARDLLTALESYECAFKAMVASGTDSDRCAEVDHCLEKIRQAASLNSRDLLFCTIQLVLAHSSFTSTKLRQDELAALQPDRTPISQSEIEALRCSHDRAVQRLRHRCQSLLPAG